MLISQPSGIRAHRSDTINHVTNRIASQKRGSYNKDPEELRKALLSCWITWDDLKPSINSWCKSSSEKVSKSTLKDHLKKSHVNVLKGKFSNDFKKSHVDKCVDDLIAKKSGRTVTAINANRILTESEELCTVQTVLILAKGGFGCTPDEMKQIINARINWKEDERFTTDCSDKICRNICDRHPDMMKVVAAAGIDPARANKANTFTRDQVFSKFDAFIKNLYKQNRVPWKSAKEIPNCKLFNMDEVGTDTTKHRGKVIAPAALNRLFARTPEGDRMNMHVTACVTTQADGAFKDSKAGIDGACGIVLIHSDKSKSKSSQESERERQRNGESPSDHVVSPRFLEGIDDKDVKMLTTNSGSVTQETFFEHAKHFVSSLPENSGPVILLLDGHASRWNAAALDCLMKNQVYCFFLASHTSIWSQPNDVGVNKRLHWCIEEVVKLRRKEQDTPNVFYFNFALSEAIKKFKEKERKELVKTGCNATTSAYEKTGIYPFNPYSSAWEEAIDSLGCFVEQKGEKVISYEPVLKEVQPELSESETKAIRKDYSDERYCNLLDSDIAIQLGNKILGLWREKIAEGVSEGNNPHEYSKVLNPTAVVPQDDEALKVAMKLLTFEKVDVAKLAQSCPEMSKEEKEKVNDVKIVSNTKVAEPISIKWFLPKSNPTDETEGSEDEWFSGTALKSNGKEWTVILATGETFKAGSDEILDDAKCKIMNTYQEITTKEAKHQEQRRRRMRAKAQREKEKRIREEAMDKRKQQDSQMEKEMLSKIEKGEWTSEDFLSMLSRARKPHEYTIEDCEVKISGDDVAIMMEKSCMKYIAENVLVNVKKKKRPRDEDASKKPKRRKTAACDTQYGNHIVGAMVGSIRRDIAQQQKLDEKEKTRLSKELTNIKAALKAADNKKKIFESQRAIPGMTASEYWTVSKTSSAADLTMILRLFDPSCGKLSKKVSEQFEHITRKKLQQKSKLAFDRKVEEYQERAKEIETCLNQNDDVSQDQNQQNNSDNT